MKHLIPEFDKLKRRYPPGFESSLVLPCLRRIQEERGYVADEDIAGLVEYLGVPRIQIEEVPELLRAIPAQADRPLPHPGVPQHLVLAAGRRADPRPPDEAPRHRAGADDTRRPLHADHRRMSRRVRDGAGADGRRDVSREHDAREDRRAVEERALAWQTRSC
jgi:hypothetical protein